MTTSDTEIAWTQPWRDEWPLDPRKLFFEPLRTRYFGAIGTRCVVFAFFGIALVFGANCYQPWGLRPWTDGVLLVGVVTFLIIGAPLAVHYLFWPFAVVANLLKPPKVRVAGDGIDLGYRFVPFRNILGPLQIDRRGDSGPRLLFSDGGRQLSARIADSVDLAVLEAFLVTRGKTVVKVE